MQNFISDLFTGVTLLRNSKDPYKVPKIYLSDAKYAQDPSYMEDWQDLNIGLIINVTDNDPAPMQTRELYEHLDIEYVWAPISDNDEPLPQNYIKNIVNYVRSWMKQHKNDDGLNILIHCSAGINRSALVAAAILWYTTPNRQKIWKTPYDLIADMRHRQFRDRKTLLLINPHFQRYLVRNLS